MKTVKGLEGVIMLVGERRFTAELCLGILDNNIPGEFEAIKERLAKYPRILEELERVELLVDSLRKGGSREIDAYSKEKRRYQRMLEPNTIDSIEKRTYN